MYRIDGADRAEEPDDEERHPHRMKLELDCAKPPAGCCHEFNFGSPSGEPQPCVIPQWACMRTFALAVAMTCAATLLGCIREWALIEKPMLVERLRRRLAEWRQRWAKPAGNGAVATGR